MNAFGRWRRVPVSAVVALGGLVATLATSSGGCSSEADVAPAAELVLETCGDGVCSHDEGEVCETCPADCGECPTCGDGKCETGSGLESCESCEEDCGACSVCGDGTCVEASGEDCQTCAEDCGTCVGCGDGSCSEQETCDSCAADCGECSTCGNGTCDGGETCTSCEEDCGACEACGDGTCDANEDCNSCVKDCGTCQRKGCVQGDFKFYYGGVHAHTHVSDGTGSPLDAFKYASQAAKPPLDFLYLSDHRNGITPAEWKGCRAAADKFNKNDSFIAGCGYERTMFEGGKGIGHFNTLFPDKLYKLPAGIPGIYKFLADCGPCLGQFNHPPWPGTFNNYKFYPVAEDKVRLIEFNGKGSWKDKMAAYFTSLDNGWYVSPSWNEDNHHGHWGDTPRATLIWAPKLTRATVRQAVLGNRTAATDDDTSRIKMTADGACWMGSKLHGLGTTEIKVELRDKQAKDGFGVLKLLGPNQKELASAACKGENPCVRTFKLKFGKSGYVVAVARQQDGDVIVSAPIWYDP